MSSAITWGAEGLTTKLSQATTPRFELALENRLNSLREVALTLLREVDSIRSAQPPRTDRSVSLQDEVQRFEIDLIRSALERTNGNQTHAAQLLGVKITTLNTKIKRYKISFVSSAEAVNDVQEEQNAA
jgi:transcriptional regulator with GAF, ATPase, and Fis domain